MAGRFSDLAVASTNHRKTQASSTAAGGAYVLRRLTPPQTAKVQVSRQENLKLNDTHPRSGFHTGDWRHRHDPGERSRSALEAALDRFQTAFRAPATSS